MVRKHLIGHDSFLSCPSVSINTKRCEVPFGFKQAKGTWYLLSFLFFLFVFFPLTLQAADKTYKTEKPNTTDASPTSKDENPDGKTEPRTLALKLMIVNPSDKFKQIYPLKAYLPEEVKPDHIVDKADLEINYDADKKAYYLSRELEMEPGETVIKSIKVEDIWFITDERLKNLSDEAHDLFDKLSGTQYESQGRLLLNNIEVALVQITERQTDKTLSAQEHISAYRENKKKVNDIEMDMMALRRFLAASGNQDLFGKKGKKNAENKLSAVLEHLAKNSSSGSVPAWVLWKVIFSILVFVGLVTLLFVGVLHQQIRKSLAKLYQHLNPSATKPEKPIPTDQKLRIGDFYPGLTGRRETTPDDHHAA